jgi:hypothetical protein
MKFSTKRRIKWWLALATLFASGYLFLLLGAGAYALGLSGLCVAIFYAVVWPEVWTGNDEVRGKRRLYLFTASLIAPVALILMAPLLQPSLDARAKLQNSSGSE